MRSKLMFSAFPAVALALVFAFAQAASAQNTVNYVCGQNSKLTAAFLNGGSRVRINFPGANNVVLNQVQSADGGRYRKGNIVFWTKGNGAQLTMPNFNGNCTQEGSVSPSPSEGKTVNYACGPNSTLTATFIDGGSRVRIQYGLTFAVLDQVQSADGGKYQKDDITFWTKGRGAQLTMRGFNGNCTQQ